MGTKLKYVQVIFHLGALHLYLANHNTIHELNRGKLGNKKKNYGENSWNQFYCQKWVMGETGYYRGNMSKYVQAIFNISGLN